MPTPTETATSTTPAFTAAWQEWHAEHERHRADPHGFLAVTHLHWLGSEDAPLDGVPGAWSVENDVVTVVLGPGESLLRDGRELNTDAAGATVVFGPSRNETASTSTRGTRSSSSPSAAASTSSGRGTRESAAQRIPRNARIRTGCIVRGERYVRAV
ncbi:conserved hypothetical protein [Arthrobacter sp. Hiyo8]|nr:conserved hypothetical protein [Arthrobacter sp. Hiyo8]